MDRILNNNRIRKYWYNIVDWCIYLISRPFFKRNVRRLSKEIDKQPDFLLDKVHNELSWEIPESLKNAKPFWWINKSWTETKFFWQNSGIYSKAKSPILTVLYSYLYTKTTVKSYFKYHHTTNCNMTIAQHEEWWKQNGRGMEDRHHKRYDWNKHKHILK